MSWFRAHFVDVWPDIASFSRVWVWNLLTCLCGAPSLTRDRVCPLSEPESLYAWQSVSQYVLVPSPLCGRLTRYCFLFKCLSLKFVDLSLWGALSDEKPGVSFVRVRVTLRLTVSHSVSLGAEPTLWTFDQILLPFQEFGSGICCPVSVGRPLWRETGSAICQSQSHFTANSQSVCLGVNVWPDIASFSRVWVWNLLSRLCGVPSLTRGRVCHL
jgi:hypothetical protein